MDESSDMCGIVGKISLTHAPVKEADLLRMCDQLQHRGPDDAGCYLSPQKHVALGHRRLSIVDLSSNGHQPMNYRNRYWITFGGEIYNFKSLRKELEREGYQFKSRTDTEIILAIYDKYQAACVTHLRGMFAFAIFDEQKNILFCARDRVGQKPFKYFFDGKTFLFASELKAILTQSEYTRALDEVAIHHYLTYQFVPAPLTGFKNIHKLLPGHTLTLDLNKKKLVTTPYWHLNFSPKKRYTKQEWTEQVSRELQRAVKEQMVADVPLGAFLSGGVDSSAMVAIMSQESSAPIKTFSIGFAEQAYNELSYARQIANHFHTDHTEFIVKPETIEILPELVAAFEEPYADSSAIPTYYLSHLTRQHVTVAVSGDGGDENFAGYARYNFHKVALLLDRLKMSQLPWSAIAPFFPTLLPTTLSMRAERFLTSLNTSPLERYVTYLCYFTNPMKDALYQPTWQAQFRSNNSYQLMENFVDQTNTSRFDQALLADIATYLPDDLLVKVDITSMLHSLEVRSPFLDHEFMELTASMPPDLKLRGFRQNKYILKKALQNIVPAATIQRRKMGFIVPIEQWFRGDLKEYAESLLLSPHAQLTQTMFRREAIEQLLQRHTATTTNLAPPLWALMTLELWLRRYFPN